MINPWFFLSYARTDSTGNEYLKKFYHELAAEVRRIAALDTDVDANVGFFDANGIETGSHWKEKVAGALRTSRVLLCMYSRGFFNSAFCGREFQAFKSRVDDYVRKAGQEIDRPALVIPVFWDCPARLPNPLPGSLSEIQYTDEEFGETYTREGLYFLMKIANPKYTSEYSEFLLRLAGRVVRVAEAHPLEPLDALKPFEEIESAFHAKSTRTQLMSLSKSSRTGPKVAQFIYVAGKCDEYNGIRTKIDCYGGSSPEWQPYHPQFDQAVGIMSQAIATTEGLFYESFSVDQNFLDKLREAEEKNNIVVIVVDPWSIQVETYQNQMMAFDRKEFVNCGVLIPWNEKDAETTQNMDLLQSRVAQTFKRKFILNSYFRNSIRSADELQREISIMINDARMRLLRKVEVEQTLSGATLPSISGSGQNVS